MALLSDHYELADVQRLYRCKKPGAAAAAAAGPLPAGPQMLDFFKNSVEKRQTRFARLAQACQQLIPPSLNEHCALEAYARGSLCILVDSAAHLYELKQLLLAGLEKQLKIACKAAGLRKIVLKHGRWYEGSTPGTQRPCF